MSAVGDELERRAKEHHARRADRAETEVAQLRAARDFESREIHPFERNCPMGLHKLGLPFYGVASGWDDRHRRPKTILVCAACWRQHPDSKMLEEIDATP